ncbi:MAG: DUF4328 domain-containing protein [Mycobacteriaceae bacterium]|nr:DUF4328 domain-containing protein [Mycobacteriaceae bacterium]
MIQVCSQCGTQWNVHERQREWCPRCRGQLMAPVATGVQLGARPLPPPPRLPPGYRWIAMRPGAPPRAWRRRRPLGPTPRYAVIPRWGLADRIEQSAASPQPAPRKGPSAAAIRATLLITVVVLGAAAVVYFARYVLLLINRNTLLNPIMAAASIWLGVAATVAALIMVSACFVLLARWLIARRAAAFTHRGQPEPRSRWALWAGCLAPLANLFWAPVYVVELAVVEDHYGRLRKAIWVWWTGWILSTAVSIFAIATSRVSDAQGIANNTVATTVGYLLAAAAMAALTSVFEGFERKPVERPAHRWVVVDDDGVSLSGSAAGVEIVGQDPAA